MGMTAMMFPMTAGQYDLVYNSLSFTLASMGASTFFFWLRLGSVHEKYKSAMTITCVAFPLLDQSLSSVCHHAHAAHINILCSQWTCHLHRSIPLHPHLQFLWVAGLDR